MASYKAVIAVLFAFSTSVNAFSCGDSSPAACKTKFTTKFEDDFKVLYVSAMQKFLTTYIDLVKAASIDLPQDEPMRYGLNERVTKVEKDIENLNANANDAKKTAEIILAAFEHMNGRSSVKYDQLYEERHFHEQLQLVLTNLHLDTAKLWADTYTGLRPEDLKAFPAYESANKIMEKILGPISIENGDVPRITLFNTVGEQLGRDFDMKYFGTVANQI